MTCELSSPKTVCKFLQDPQCITTSPTTTQSSSLENESGYSSSRVLISDIEINSDSTETESVVITNPHFITPLSLEERQKMSKMISQKELTRSFIRWEQELLSLSSLVRSAKILARKKADQKILLSKKNGIPSSYFPNADRSLKQQDLNLLSISSNIRSSPTSYVSDSLITNELNSSLNASEDQKASCGCCCPTQNCTDQEDSMVTLKYPFTGQQCVSVLFESDEWKISHPTIKTDKFWEFTTKIKHSKPFLFKFIVDGEWKSSPLHPKENDGFQGYNNIIVLISIEWTFPALEVFLCTALAGWTDRIKLPFCHTRQKHIIIFEFPGKGVFEFKFIVDGEWKINPNLEIINEGPHQNNCIKIY